MEMESFFLWKSEIRSAKSETNSKFKMLKTHTGKPESRKGGSIEVVNGFETLPTEIGIS